MDFIDAGLEDWLECPRCGSDDVDLLRAPGENVLDLHCQDCGAAY